MKSSLKRNQINYQPAAYRHRIKKKIAKPASACYNKKE
jgi:hypothetical protein